MNIKGEQLRLQPLGDNYEGLECCAANLVNDFGMDSVRGCMLSSNGFTMWLKKTPEGGSLSFRLEKTAPVGQLLVWNYNRISEDGTDYTVCGLRKIQVYHSIDGKHWTELQKEGYPYCLKKASGTGDMQPTNLEDGKIIDFGGVTAQYIRLAWQGQPGIHNYDSENVFGGLFGLAKLQLYSGTGLYTQPAAQWTRLLERRDGWAGADGIFSMPFNGADNVPNHTRTLLMFGDTFIGSRIPGTDKRSDDTVMINNSGCILKEGTADPDQAEFLYQKMEDGTPASLICPDVKALGIENEAPFFWGQDSMILHGRYYAFPLIVREDPQGVEGYQFAVEGTAFLSAPVENGEILWEKMEQSRSPLVYRDKDGGELVFGAAIFLNTVEAKAPDPDGYLYIYGYKAEWIEKNLYVARIQATDFPRWEKMEYYDGTDWSPEIAKAACLCRNVSCEMSFSPYFGKLYEGKYILVFTEYTNSPIVSCRIADSPVGPFSEIIQLYHCPEPELGYSIYTYNAKAHPNLSEPGRLLVSYNTNACSMEANQEKAMIYSPRFIEICESVQTD